MGSEWMNPLHDLDGVEFSDAFDGSIRDILKRHYERTSIGITRSIMRGGTIGAIAGYIAHQAFDLPPETLFYGGAAGVILDCAQYNLQYAINLTKHLKP